MGSNPCPMRVRRGKREPLEWILRLAAMAAMVPSSHPSILQA